MKIVMITGSPHKHGTSAVLAEEFIKGVQENGHEIIRFDAALADVHPCKACNYCVDHGGKCIYEDEMAKIRPAILAADMVVLVTPLYYFGMSTQLKAVIDRFYAFNDELILSKKKKSIMLAACGDEEEWVTDALVQHYQTICRYLSWECAGMVLAKGVYLPEDVIKTNYPVEARTMGERIVE